MNKHQGLVCWGPHVHIENFWYSGAILAMSHLIFMFAFLHCSTAHSHFIDEGSGKKAGKNVKDPQLYSLPWHTALLSSFYAVMMRRGISTFILNMQLIIITAPHVGREFISATRPGHRELQDVVTELCPCAWGARRRQLLGNPGGLLRCCPSQGAPGDVPQKCSLCQFEGMDLIIPSGFLFPSDLRMPEEKRCLYKFHCRSKSPSFLYFGELMFLYMEYLGFLQALCP